MKENACIHVREPINAHLWYIFDKCNRQFDITANVQEV